MSGALFADRPSQEQTVSAGCSSSQALTTSKLTSPTLLTELLEQVMQATLTCCYLVDLPSMIPTLAKPRKFVMENMKCRMLGMGSATGWDGWDTSHSIFLLFNTTPMGVARKESTPQGLPPPQYSEGGGAPDVGNREQKVLQLMVWQGTYMLFRHDWVGAPA